MIISIISTFSTISPSWIEPKCATQWFGFFFACLWKYVCRSLIVKWDNEMFYLSLLQLILILNLHAEQMHIACTSNILSEWTFKKVIYTVHLNFAVCLHGSAGNVKSESFLLLLGDLFWWPGEMQHFHQRGSWKELLPNLSELWTGNKRHFSKH